MTEGREPRAQPPHREQVSSFLTDLHARPIDDLEPLGGGWWSSAWGYQVGDEELVVRFGEDASWFEADRKAMAFAAPNLPVPEVREISTTPEGRAYAISVRHHGVFLESVAPERAETLTSTLGGLLVALHSVPSHPDLPVLWHQRVAPPCSWRQFLMAGLVDDAENVVHGWSTALGGDPKLAALSAGVVERIQDLLEAVPERRDLLHGDLLHGNVLVTTDARALEAVFSWKCSVRGDFLFDAAWCTFWAPWHEGLKAADPLAGVLAAPAIRADPGALLDAASRHHCYELHIGFTHLGWNIWTDNEPELEATATRLSDILQRGPLPRFGAPPSSAGVHEFAPLA